MPSQLFSSAKPSLAFAKIVANPTASAWSQVYNAGSLFAVLSLALKEPDDRASLATTGKKLVNNLEAEFFTLEDKSLASIKDAISKSLEDCPEPVLLNVC